MLLRTRELPLAKVFARSAARLGVAGLLVLAASSALQSAVAEGDTRTLTMHHVHTGETITVTFKRDGRYVPSALKKLDWFLRDWRKGQETNMDPHLFDLLWQVYRESGATQPIDIICGYRSPGTNAMLRERSSGVARYSEHILGKAIDFYIPGVPLAKLRAIGLELQRGGVGFYPTSGSPFVHMDVGLVRHWPQIARGPLQKIFPDGRTVHIPADGKPLRNYAAALADIERHGNAPSARSLEAARAAGVISEGQVQEAELMVTQPRQPRSLFARLFGFGRKRNTDSADAPVASRQARAPLRVASAVEPKRIATHAIAAKRASSGVPLPVARPRMVMTAHVKRKTPALLQTATFNGGAVTRNIWGDVINSGPGSRQAAETPLDVAAANTEAAGSTGALAYAPEADSSAVERLRPMGSSVPRLAREATVMPPHGNTTVAVKPPEAVADGRPDSPWLRAAMLTPDVSRYMTATRVGKVDPTWLQGLLQKPEHAVMMSFSADPHLGMVADRFSGHAVVFLATATFAPQTTASLQ